LLMLLFGSFSGVPSVLIGGGGDVPRVGSDAVLRIFEGVRKDGGLLRKRKSGSERRPAVLTGFEGLLTTSCSAKLAATSPELFYGLTVNPAGAA